MAFAMEISDGNTSRNPFAELTPGKWKEFLRAFAEMPFEVKFGGTDGLAAGRPQEPRKAAEVGRKLSQTGRSDLTAYSASSGKSRVLVRCSRGLCITALTTGPDSRAAG